MPKREVINQDDGPDVHVWTDAQGQRWACAAYDHGPFCRLCQRADDVLIDILANVRDGLMDVKAGPDGSLSFKATVKGNARAEDMINTDPEMAALYARVQQNQGETQASLSPIEERVLVALSEYKEDGLSTDAIAESLDVTAGQVEHALGTLARLGFIE